MATLCFIQKLENEQSVVHFNHYFANVPEKTLDRIKNIKEEDRQWLQFVLVVLSGKSQVTIWNAEMQAQFDAEFPEA